MLVVDGVIARIYLGHGVDEFLHLFSAYTLVDILMLHPSTCAPTHPRQYKVFALTRMA